MRLLAIIIAALSAACLIAWQAQDDPNLQCPIDPGAQWHRGGVARVDGIRIEGSAEFITNVATAMRRAWDIPSYRYIRNIRRIVERDLPSNLMGTTLAEIHLATRTVSVSPEAARSGCVRLASVLIHEGAHVSYASHRDVYDVQAQASREMGDEAGARKWELNGQLVAATEYGLSGR